MGVTIIIDESVEMRWTNLERCGEEIEKSVVFDRSEEREILQRFRRGKENYNERFMLKRREREIS